MKNLLLLISIVVSLFSLGCSKEPELDFQVIAKESYLEFNFDYKNINGLLSIIVWEKYNDSPLWQLDMNYFKGNRLVYDFYHHKQTTSNELQTGIKQIYPANKEKPIFPSKDKIIYISIGYQYDSFLTAYVDNKVYQFEIDENNKVHSIVEAKRNTYSIPSSVH